MNENNKYIYCIPNEDCIHRHGCKRWLMNYKEEPKDGIMLSNPQKNCINEEPYPFSMLDRFRNSNERGYI